MTLANTSRVVIQYKPESTFGTIATGAKYYDLRVTGESLEYQRTKTTSAELVGTTRSVSSQTTTSANASGGINAELSIGEYDRLMAGTLQSTWAVSGTNGALTLATTAAFASTTITFAVAPTHGIVSGQWFRMSKTGGLNDNKLFRASTSVAPTSTVITLDASTPAVTESAASGYTLQAARVSNGTTQTSYSIQRNSTDLSPVEYMTYRGMTPSKLSVNTASGSLSTISFDFMGKDATRGTPGTNPLINSGGTNTTSFTYPVMSGVTATNCVLWAGGTPVTGTYIKSIGFDFDNSLRVQEAVCNLGAVGIGSGTINCSVKAQMYFAEGAKFFSDFTGDTYQELLFSIVDSNGYAYVFTFPSVTVSSYKVNAGGKDSDLLVDVTFTALRDSTLSKVLVIDRCAPAIDLS